MFWISTYDPGNLRFSAGGEPCTKESSKNQLNDPHATQALNFNYASFSSVDCPADAFLSNCSAASEWERFRCYDHSRASILSYFEFTTCLDHSWLYLAKFLQRPKTK